ncbi:signal peptidase I [Candidatus Giovannonibacteria bacterium RIFCSPLOWO2_01_FULL_43_160]|uniref:Signal peptidase I n=3 Tax=Parcubacteria group TaxID=1794811 RepID=A0A0G1IXH4_9BACT|nr:MAG: Signal peptidase I [Candidatus Jorgensenbacteria bacterium GW2011_GWF2_41_8]KKS96803.1 MAG: Signal peptidase I [Candidatus Giovannonibacteria bacterium GW2011_GWB1_43_13]KKS99695.1 MAG: Signal peptidase I [Candidatus Giovannonibacteria bacterium GW2011_GWA1_43_15]KKT21895.1 MAG: Signal peptidase I [Candidatus Giovannonibacteria bacterium GW2011_GWC2_43_8]KKT63780.1 MAG: Signal peptidase I [Candidatus Giovannonibacteria bacterium GW2011_GWA2_44_26]OGF58246.1 MAG: signal peptidase I [Can
MDENKKIEEGHGSAVWEFIKVVVISVAIVLPIRTYIAQPFIVSGASMEPNFHNGEYLIIDELTYELRLPERGEVVVFRYPLNPSEFFIKRVIGLPGEKVEIKNGKITINGLELAEPYLLANLETAPNVKMELTENQYFVLGDNRPHSSDSRFWGALPKEKLMGRALVRLWPIAKAGIIK